MHFKHVRKANGYLDNSLFPYERSISDVSIKDPLKNSLDHTFCWNFYRDYVRVFLETQSLHKYDGISLLCLSFFIPIAFIHIWGTRQPKWFNSTQAQKSKEISFPDRHSWRQNPDFKGEGSRHRQQLEGTLSSSLTWTTATVLTHLCIFLESGMHLSFSLLHFLTTRGCWNASFSSFLRVQKLTELFTPKAPGLPLFKCGGKPTLLDSKLAFFYPIHCHFAFAGMPWYTKLVRAR